MAKLKVSLITTVFNEEDNIADFIKSMASWYKKLHSIKSSNTPHLKKKGYYSLYERFKRYNKTYKKVKPVLTGDIRTECETFFSECDTLFKKYDKLFSRRKRLSLNHGDPTRSNVFYSKGNVRLVDWGFVGYDLKEQDLVFFEYSYDLTKRQNILFLKTYGYPDSKIANKQLNINVLLHLMGLIVWRIERLELIHIGKADLRQKASNKNKMIRELKEDLTKSRNCLKQHNKTK